MKIDSTVLSIHESGWVTLGFDKNVAYQGGPRVNTVSFQIDVYYADESFRDLRLSQVVPLELTEPK